MFLNVNDVKPSWIKGQVLHFVELHSGFVGGLFVVCVCLIIALTRKSRWLRGCLYAIKGFPKNTCLHRLED